MKRNNQYDENYYENGVQLGISGYSAYRWLPELTVPLCKRLVTYLGLENTDKVCDYGCAKGYLVKGLRGLNKQAFGVDISEYAIEKADPSVREFLSLLSDKNDLKSYRKTIVSQIDGDTKFDWIISKDVLEHVSYEQISDVLYDIRENSKNAFIIVPLGVNGKYVIPEYEQDITHVIRENATWWTAQVLKAGFILNEVKFRVPGIKDNWAHYEEGNLFMKLYSR